MASKEMQLSPRSLLHKSSRTMKNSPSSKNQTGRSFVGTNMTKDLRARSNTKTSDMFSPSQNSRRNLNLSSNQSQLRKPLADADHEEGHAGDDYMSQIIDEDNLLWTNRTQKEVNLPPQLQLTTLQQSQFRPRAVTIAQKAQNSSALMSNNFISPEQLMHVLADSSSQAIGGEVVINGMSYKLKPTGRHHKAQSMVLSSEMSDDLSRADLNDNLSMHSMFLKNHQPPMNEQSNNDEPILAINHVGLSFHQQQLRRASAQNGRQQSPFIMGSDRHAPYHFQPARAKMSTNKHFFESFAANQSPTALIQPKISQNISGGSLSPEDSFGEQSPNAATSVMAVFKLSTLNNQQSSESNIVFSAIAPAKINNLMGVDEQSDGPFDSPSIISMSDGPRRSVLVVLADLEQPPQEDTKQSILETEKTPEPTSSSGLPQLGQMDLRNRKKKKGKKAPIPILLPSSSKVVLPSSSVQQSAEVVAKTLPNAMPNLASKKKKKKGKVGVKIDLPQNNKTPVQEVQKQKDFKPLNDLKTPGMGQMSKKSVFDNFLSQLENEVGHSKKRKKPKVQKTDIAQTCPQVNLNDLDKEFIKAQMKRNNSDTIRSKDELKSKKIILRELQDLKESLIYQQDQDKSEIDIGFLHASPIFIDGIDSGRTGLVPLKFQEEKQAIIEAIKKSDQQVRFEQSVATKDKFIEMIRKRPSVLHISCHGFDQTDTSMKLRSEADMRNLLFETENGDGKLISQRELSKILKQVTTKIKVVFVAACMSQFVGEIFQQCDVPHVICSQQGKSILDLAAISFSQSFYTKMLSGEAICKAFQSAKDEVSVKFSDEEANRFQLMISTGQHKHHSKHCTTRWPQKKGDLDCRSDHIKFKAIRSKITNFIPREIEFFKLVKYIQNEHKLVHFRGLPGIGKSHLVRNVLHYLSERKYFSAGIMYFALNDVKSATQFLNSLRNSAIMFFKLNPQQRYELRQKYASENEMQDFMVTIFDDKAQPEMELQKKKNFSQSKDRRFLLALDNCEALIDKHGEEFRNLLSFFNDKCKLLKILVISRNDFGSSYEGEQIQPLILPQLGSKQAVQFFLDVLGDEKRMKITTDEIVELILHTPFYPFNKAIPQQGVIIPEQITDESRKDQKKLIEGALIQGMDNSKVVEILSYHDLFRLLQGNPTSLTRAANIYLNPFNETQSLIDLYNQVKQSNQISDEDQQPENIDDTRPKPRLNNESIQAMTRLAIEMLPSEDAKSLLYFIGCMPAGLTRNQLNAIWGGEKVKEYLPSLQQMNLVEQSDHRDQSDTRYELSPILCQFINQDIEKENMEKCMHLIIKHYAVVVKDVYSKAALNKEIAEEEGNSPTMSNGGSPRKQFAWQHSFNQSSESLNFEQMSKGFNKQSFDGGNQILGSVGLWSNSTIDISVTAQVFKDLPNLQYCMEFLIGLNASAISETKENSLGQKPRTDSLPGAEEVFHNESNQNMFSSTFDLSRTNICGSEVLQQMQKQKIASRITSRPSRQLKKLGSSDTIFETHSSFGSTLGFSPAIRSVPILVEQLSKESIKTQSSGNESSNNSNGKRRTQSVKFPSNRVSYNRQASLLDVIEETHEPHYMTKNSQQPEEDITKVSNFVAPKEPALPLMQKIDSSPFAISLAPLDPLTPKKSQAISGDGSAKKQMPNEKVTRVISQLNNLGHMIKQQSFSLNLTDTMTKCDKMLIKMRNRQGSVKVQTDKLNPMAKNDRLIFDNNEDDEESQNDFFDFQNNEETKIDLRNCLIGEQQSNEKPGTQQTFNLQIPAMGGGIQVHALESDRSFLRQESDDNDDPLNSIRQGDDFDDDTNSKISDFLHQSSFNKDQLVREIEIQNYDPSESSNSVRRNSLVNKIAGQIGADGETDDGLANNFNFPIGENGSLDMSQSRDRRHTVNHMKQRKNSGLLRNQSADCENSPDPASITMNHQLKRRLTDRFGTAMNQKLQNKLKILDQQAAFTLRGRSGTNSGNSRRGSQIVLNSKGFSQAGMDYPSQRPTPRKFIDSGEKMTLYGQFIVYLAATTYLIDDFTFAYQISSTNFEGIAGSILFCGNILRLKALAAEQIFLRYFDVNEVENSFPVVAYIVEAIQSATQALKYYTGEVDGLAGANYLNNYGLGLQNFHLGYLFSNYSEHLTTTRAQSTYEEVCGCMTMQKFKERAIEHYKMAYSNFDQMVHLKGMYLAKKHEAELYEVQEYDDGEDDIDIVKTRAKKMASRLRRDYFEHVKKFGYDSICYIPRHHGDQISLLTEIVEQNKRSPLFRTPSRGKQRENAKPTPLNLKQIGVKMQSEKPKKQIMMPGQQQVFKR